jgi:hypothetical protein
LTRLSHFLDASASNKNNINEENVKYHEHFEAPVNAVASDDNYQSVNIDVMAAQPHKAAEEPPRASDGSMHLSMLYFFYIDISILFYFIIII